MLKASAQRLNNERRDRFLLLLDRRLRGYVDLGRGLLAMGISERTYYRWKNGRVVPKESALRRHCLNVGFDAQYVLTGIPHEVGGKYRSLSVYQHQHRQAQSMPDRVKAFVRVAAESFLVVQEEFSKATLALDCTPQLLAAMVYEVETLLRFEILIRTMPSGYVAFELFRVACGVRTSVAAANCEEGTLLQILRLMRYHVRAHHKKQQEEDYLGQYQKLEKAYLAKHNGRHTRR